MSALTAVEQPQQPAPPEAKIRNYEAVLAPPEQTQATKRNLMQLRQQMHMMIPNMQD